MLPIGDDLEIREWRPVATYVLVGLLAGAFLYVRLWQGPWQAEAWHRALGLVPARLLGEPASAWPTLVSSLFLHGSVVHLLGNALFLWVFGRALESELRWFFLPYFVGLGAVAGLGSALLRWESTTPSIGASGAISGLLGAYLVLFPTANVRVLVVIWAPLAWLLNSPLPAFDVPAWLFLPVWLGLQVVGGLGNLFSPSGVDYGAHLAGFLGGYVATAGLRRAFGLWPDSPRIRLGWDPLYQPAPAPRGPILVARRPLPAGRVLQADDLEVVARPRGYADPDPVPARERHRVLGRRLRVERYRFEPLLWSHLEPPDSGPARE